MDWVAPKSGGVFSRETPLGSGADYDASRKPSAAAGPALPTAPDRVKHPMPWRAPRSGGQVAFSQYAKDPQPGPMELAQRRAADVAQRRRYKPEEDGKEPWRPTELEGSEFSKPIPDARFVRMKEEQRVAELMHKFGLGPGGTGEMVEEYVDPDAID